MWKKRRKSLTPEQEEMIRNPTIWGYISGGIFGSSGILIVIWWAGNELAYGLAFWAFFSLGFFVQVICGIRIGNTTPLISKRKLKMRALVRGTILGLIFGVAGSLLFLVIVIVILFIL
jgi:hypothetical protein